VSFAPNGDLYSLSLSFDVFDTNNAIIVNKSTNGGQSWGAPLDVTADDTNGLDKQSITADPYDANRVYAVWDRFLSPPGINASDHGKTNARSYVQQAWFSRTTNGGASWEPARVLFNPGTQAWTIGNIVVVLPNATHDLLDGMVLVADHKAQLRGAQIAVVRSTDHGVTWSKKPTIIGQIDPSFFGPTDPDNGNAIRGGDLPDFAVDPHNGNVYAAWDDDSVYGIDTIFFSQSTDGGATWSAPIKINQTPTNIPAGDQQAFTATLGVLANGTVGVTYYDLRDNTAAPGVPTNAWLVRCTANCGSAGSWGNEAHVGGPFDIEQAADAGGYFVGDYEGMTTSGNVFQPFFGMAVNRATDPSDAFFTTVP
ncbi:MAG: exo-alpha-sialidase, partial [Burkholderia sp.]|nr:exo-alpha-sialidase [Burkholderia sp.]